MSENDEESDGFSFISENPILFKKYKVLQKICEGAFGSIYLGYFMEKNVYVAIKVESRKTPNQHLETEAYFLYSLKGIGIPEIISFGKTKNYNILVEPFLGKSLYHLYVDNNNHFEIKDICLIGIQAIDRLEWIHSKNIIHRDIKPDNFLIGEKDPNILYLIDFGLSTKYRSSISGRHIKFGITGKLTGTTKYSSANTIRGGEQSRKDDLESVAYMIIFFMKGELPWQNVKSNAEENKYIQIYLMKKNIPVEELCKGLPKEIYEFLKYIKELDFEQKPDYNHLRSLFIKLLYKHKYIYNDKLTFSWVTNDINLDNTPINLNKRKSNFHNRLLKCIEKNLELKINKNVGSNANLNYNNNNLFMNNSSNFNDKLIDNNELDSTLSLKQKKKNKSKKSLYDNNVNISLLKDNTKLHNYYQNYINESDNFNETNDKNNSINFNKKNPIKKKKNKNVNRNNSYCPKENRYLYSLKKGEKKEKDLMNENGLITEDNNNNMKKTYLKNNILINTNIYYKNKYNNIELIDNKIKGKDNYFQLNKVYDKNIYNRISNNKLKTFHTLDNKSKRNKNYRYEKTPKLQNNTNKRIQLSSAKDRKEEIYQDSEKKINQENNIKYITKIENNNYNYFSIIPHKSNILNKKKQNLHANDTNGVKDYKFNNSFYVRTINDFNFNEVKNIFKDNDKNII